jgi:serine/threonine protein kinase
MCVPGQAVPIAAGCAVTDKPRADFDRREAFALLNHFLDLDAAQRQHELKQLAQDRPDLYSEVTTLLRASDQAQALGFFAGETADLSSTRFDMLDSANGLIAGASFGPYRLDHMLGSGGMGQVWLATRVDGLYEGQVAIKTLHQRGLHVGARERFAREGQLLAKLAHPHIARLLDAGVTADGLLYLVLEYVDGERLDRWCDQQRLPIDARLRLFLDVCAAVAHAHSHLIVHRDLKPSNILVSRQGEVKLLDFGIAKLLENEAESSAREADLTQIGGRLLTPEFASPEQIRGEAITTASDVYSLGVLLFGLLCGRRPYGASRSTSSQIELMALETEPRLPSQAAKTRDPGDTDTAETARLRDTQPGKLAKMLRGDLDNIVAKSLKKDQQKRYLSVLALAADIRHHLDHEPVEARGDPFGYRSGKFLRKYRFGVAAVALLLLSLIAGIAGTLWQARAALAAEQRARAQTEQVEARENELKQIVDFQGAMLKRVNVRNLGSGWLDLMREKIAAKLDKDKPLSSGQAAQALATFDQLRPWSQPSEVARRTLANYLLAPADKEISQRFSDQPASDASLRMSLGKAYADLGLYDDARKQFDQAYALRTKRFGAESPEALTALLKLAVVRKQSADIKGAIGAASTVYETRRRLLGDDDPETMRAATVLASIYYEASDSARALALLEAQIDKQRRVLGPEHEDTLTTEHLLGTVLESTNDYKRARQYLQLAYDGRVRTLGEGNEATLFSLGELANVTSTAGDHAEARRLFEQMAAICRRDLGDEHPTTLRALDGLAQELDNLGEKREGLRLEGEVYGAMKKQFGEGSLDFSINQSNYAVYLIDSGRSDEARQLLDAVVALRSKLLGAENPRTLYSKNNLAKAMSAQKQYAAALALNTQTLASQSKLLGPDDEDTLESARVHAEIQQAEGNDAAALKELQGLIERYRKVQGPDSPAMAIVMRDIGVSLLRSGDAAAALTQFESALAIQKHSLPEHSWDILLTQSDRAAAMHKLGRDTEALHWAELTVELMRARIDSAAPGLIDAESTLADIRPIRRA